MKKVSLADIGTSIWNDRKKILLIAVLTAVIASPVAYFLLPARYQAVATVHIPFENVEIDNLHVRVRNEVIPRLYEEKNLAGSGTSLARVDRDFTMFWLTGSRSVELYLLGDDAGVVTRMLDHLCIEIMALARTIQVEYLQGVIIVNKVKAAEVEAALTDEFITDYYDGLYKQWTGMIQSREGPYVYVFIEPDPLIKELYTDMQEYLKKAAVSKSHMNSIMRMEEDDLAKYVTPVYKPDSAVAPRPLLVVIAAALLGLVFGVVIVLLKSFLLPDRDNKKTKEYMS